MVSLLSLKNYVLINGTLVSVTFFMYYLIVHYQCVYVALLFRNYFLLYFIDYNVRDKPYIKEKHKELNEIELHENILKITGIETLSFHLLDAANGDFNFILFIPSSFVFEVIFDFFHYWIHRGFHTFPLLYKIHKKHHQHYNLTTIVTFDQSLLEFILAVSLPEMIAFFLFQSLFFKLNRIQLLMMLNYKTFSEMAGHSGKHTNSCGFVQFIWLPRFFKIELITEDHDLHHTMLSCNFAKRFKLWDKVFDTYKS